MSGALTFLDQIYYKLQCRGLTSDWNAQQLADALANITMGVAPSWYAQPGTTLSQIDENTIIDIPNHILIHEMLKRGFAVSKISGPKEEPK